MYECIYCGKGTFQTQRGLDQHMQRSSLCNAQQLLEGRDETGYYTADEGMAYTTVVNQAKVNREKQNGMSDTTKKAGDKATSRFHLWRLAIILFGLSK